jgi:hypothetical protein
LDGLGLGDAGRFSFNRGAIAGVNERGRAYAGSVFYRGWILRTKLQIAIF